MPSEGGRLSFGLIMRICWRRGQCFSLSGDGEAGGRSRIIDRETGRDLAPTDGMWIIYLGAYGCLGLLAWTTSLSLPSWLFALRVPVRQWRDPTIAPMAVLATLLGLYLVDCLVNGFLNLTYVIAAGGLVGATHSAGKTRLPIRRNGRVRGRRAVSPASVTGPKTGELSPEPAGQLGGKALAGARRRASRNDWQIGTGNSPEHFRLKVNAQRPRPCSHMPCSSSAWP